MDTVVATRTFEGDVEEVIAHCRKLDSRKSWPGAVPNFSSGDKLYYQVGMRLKGATMTDIDIEERLSPVEHSGTASSFRVAQKVTWPDGVADAEAEYLFTAGTPNQLQFTYRYQPPGTKLVKTKDLPSFHAGMEKVVARYLDRLAPAPVSSGG